MDKIKLYENLEKLSIHVYEPNNKPIPQGWELITTRLVAATGFKGAIYYNKENNIAVVAFAGTDTPGKLQQLKQFVDDAHSDIQMLFKKFPVQLHASVEFYEWAREHFPKANLILTGHSLGGSLVQLVSAQTGAKGVTFNAFGTGKILENEGYKNWRHINVDNIGNLTDAVFKINFDKQAGDTYVLDDTLNKKEIRDVILNSKDIISITAKHDVESMPSLERAAKIPPVEKQPRNGIIESWMIKKNLDRESLNLYKEYIKQLLEQKRQDLEEIQQEAEHKKRVEIDAKRRQAENDYINQMRCVAHQYGNMSIDICTSSGRREHIQSGYIPPQARPVSHQQFQIRGNSVQDVTQQLKNILNRYR